MAERRALPPPATQADEYLHDIAASLRQLVDMLAQTVAEAPAADDDEVVALRDARARTSAFKVLAARGLTLTEVGYPADELLAQRAEQTRARRELD